MGRILTIEQTAEMLQLNPQVVRRYLREGKLPGTKVGRHWRISEDDLLNSIRQEHYSNQHNKSEIETRMANKVAETAAQYEPEREWESLSREERLARIASVRGKLKRLGWSSEDFMREKHQETEEEERRWEERHRR